MFSKSFIRILIPVLALLCVFSGREAAAQCSQPVYVIAHRCNGENDVSNVVREERVNAIEADFKYGRPNVFVDFEWYVDHNDMGGNSVWAWSLTVDEWLEDVKAALTTDLLESYIGTPPSTLALIILDVKTPDGPLRELHSKIRAALGPDINLLMSFGDWDQRDQFKQLLPFDFPVFNLDTKMFEMKHFPGPAMEDPRLGLALDMLPSHVDQDDVRNFFQTYGFPRYWYADGYAAGLIAPASVDTNVKEGMRLRDEACGGSGDTKGFNGVYTWTYERKTSIEERLNWGINGIFVNASQCFGFAGAVGIWKPHEVIEHVKQNPAPGHHLASPADNPFAVKVQLHCPAPQVVECASPGGNPPDEAQIQSFLNAAQPDSCNTTGAYVRPNGPYFYPVNNPATVDFTMWLGDCSVSAHCKSTIEVKDTKAPEIACPADIEQDPSTTVTFAPTATDCCDTAPVLECTADGAFDPGTTRSVSCTATDKSQNRSACQFNVKIRSTAEVVKRLQTLVESATSLHAGEKQGLTSELTALYAALGNSNAACGKLKGFTSKIENWVRTGHMTAAEGEPILTSAGNLRKTLQCRS